MQRMPSQPRRGVVYRCLSTLTALLLLLPWLPSAAQKHNPSFLRRYVNHLLYDTTDISRPQLLVYPTVAYAPETSWEFGASSVFVFYANRDTANRLSEVSAFTFLTLERQYGIWIDHALYSQNNRWFSLGRVRFQSFPLLYHGIGPESPEEHLAQVNATLLQIKERVLRKVHGSIYTGLELDYQHLSSVEFIPREHEVAEYPLGSEGSQNLGVGAGILFDNRHNILNVRKGFFSELAFLNYHHAWGSDHSFTSILSDTRLYRAINARDVLAMQLIGQFNIGGAPFHQLAMLGGESIMRGYYLGRYRDNNQVAFQTEYRFLPLPLGFTKRLGAAVFAGAGSVFNDFRQLKASNLVWSGGAGVRFLLFPKKDIYTRLDLAFTREGTGVYIFIGEAF
ncbi:outer membrane protein assembly factor [Parachryseolinea silvisoli]|uniref:outer membrane protein assembly factor n=1 Tax=Parachryseolinea silvisoli TaxID=2873601 RepID=UPI002265DEBD|nr:outer membrane protein assembly factor [Parachryseolinea silvisoli]